MPLVRYEVTGYGIALYGLTVEHSAQPGVRVARYGMLMFVFVFGHARLPR